MRMVVNICKSHENNKHEALYKVSTQYEKNYQFYISINLKSKLVSFFKDVQQKILLGTHDLSDQNQKINISTIQNEVALMTCRAARQTIEQQKFKDNINVYLG